MEAFIHSWDLFIYHRLHTTKPSFTSMAAAAASSLILLPHRYLVQLPSPHPHPVLLQFKVNTHCSYPSGKVRSLGRTLIVRGATQVDATETSTVDKQIVQDSEFSITKVRTILYSRVEFSKQYPCWLSHLIWGISYMSIFFD